MKHTRRKLSVSRETIRLIGTHELHGAAGGLSGLRCSEGRTGCTACGGGGSLGNSACGACATEVDCATGGGCLSFEPGC